VATGLVLPGRPDSARWARLSSGPTAVSGTSVVLPAPDEISTPLEAHHPMVTLLGWTAIGLPHAEGWMSEGRTTPSDAHGTE